MLGVAEQISLPVREERGDFRGGLCRVDGVETIFLNRDHSPGQKVAVLAKALAEKPLNQVFLLPAVREAIYRKS